jgi:hypothetical protein
VRHSLIDTFGDFMRYWQDACDRPVEQKIELWASSYMQKYPELLQKQTRDYQEAGHDWREIARTRVFAGLGDRVPAMKEARQNLLQVCGPIYEQSVQALELDFPVAFVIYVGIGCGAGWATQYQDGPACLLGLEQIAGLGLQSRERLREVLAHEIGHLAHMQWRHEPERFEEQEKDPLFLLYSEGFAKRCEYLVLRKERWNQAQNEDWLHWCIEHKAWLAREYLRRVDSDEPANDFFGDWLDVQGRSQTGYYLGWTYILWLEQSYGTRDIAALPLERLRAETRSYLGQLAAGLD